MTELETLALIVVAVWLGVLTVVSLLLIRQLGLVSVRLDRERDSSGLVLDGLQIGNSVPEQISALAPAGSDRPFYVIVMGAVCGPCRDLVSDLGETVFDAPVTALISGNAEAAGALAEMLPPGVTVIQDPVAEEAARALQVQTTPFCFEVKDGVVSGKAVLRGAEHLRAFIEDGIQFKDDPQVMSVEVIGNGQPARARS